MRLILIDSGPSPSRGRQPSEILPLQPLLTPAALFPPYQSHLAGLFLVLHIPQAQWTLHLLFPPLEF